MSTKRRGLGKGVDALFPAEATEKPDDAELASSKVEGKSSELEVRSSHVEGTSKQLEVQRSKREGKSSKSEIVTPEVEDISSKLEVRSYNQAAMQMAIKDADKNPRITLWSPVSTAVLKYLRKTTPEFSISEEAGTLLEDAIRRKYPELYEGLKREKEGS
jgi:hypothetical protein